MKYNWTYSFREMLSYRTWTEQYNRYPSKPVDEQYFCLYRVRKLRKKIGVHWSRVYGPMKPKTYPNGFLTYWHRREFPHGVISAKVYAGFTEAVPEVEVRKFRNFAKRRAGKRLSFEYVRCYVRHFGYDLRRPL